MNPAVARALESLDPAPLQEIAGKAEAAGAAMLDLNPGYWSRRKEDRMEFMVDAVQAVSSLRLILDSPNPRLLARGLAAAREKPVINGLSLEKRRLDEILPLAVEHRTELVVLLMDEKSRTPATLDEKLALALELRERAMTGGAASESLIFDPLLPTLNHPEDYEVAGRVIETVRFIASGALFQEQSSVMVGLSNLRSGRRRILSAELETTCLHQLAGAGLTHLLADALNPEIQTAFRNSTRFLGTRA